ncbi:hypothetical protein RJT34_11689 [Clitoria ternatea]|uniref:Uncharacterized protein n=1 Tax=Clitoria ternatea TaxID=43366 RepID=A0AAN9JN34_CLITE
MSGAFLAQYAICFHFPSLPVHHYSKPFPSRASLPRSTLPHRRLLCSSSLASLSISKGEAEKESRDNEAMHVVGACDGGRECGEGGDSVEEGGRRKEETV